MNFLKLGSDFDFFSPCSLKFTKNKIKQHLIPFKLFKYARKFISTLSNLLEFSFENITDSISVSIMQNYCEKGPSAACK